MTLTFESADEILLCDHSNESSLPVLTHGAICFSAFYKMKFALGRSLPLATFGSQRVNADCLLCPWGKKVLTFSTWLIRTHNYYGHFLWPLQCPYYRGLTDNLT